MLVKSWLVCDRQPVDLCIALLYVAGYQSHARKLHAAHRARKAMQPASLIPGGLPGVGAEQEWSAAAARRDAAAQIAAAEADRDTSLEQTRAEAYRRVSAAEANGDQARQLAADTEEKAQQAHQAAARAQAAETAARGETERVRADAERMLGQFRAEAACERDELRADLRARAEREADAYGAELAQIREVATRDSETGR